jgi:hypothetical protein
MQNWNRRWVLLSVMVSALFVKVVLSCNAVRCWRYSALSGSTEPVNDECAKRVDQDVVFGRRDWTDFGEHRLEGVLLRQEIGQDVDWIVFHLQQSDLCSEQVPPPNRRRVLQISLHPTVPGPVLLLWSKEFGRQPVEQDKTGELQQAGKDRPQRALTFRREEQSD